MYYLRSDIQIVQKVIKAFFPFRYPLINLMQKKGGNRQVRTEFFFAQKNWIKKEKNLDSHKEWPWPWGCEQREKTFRFFSKKKFF
jgi:hypothetical protein